MISAWWLNRKKCGGFRVVVGTWNEKVRFHWQLNECLLFPPLTILNEENVPSSISSYNKLSEEWTDQFKEMNSQRWTFRFLRSHSERQEPFQSSLQSGAGRCLWTRPPLFACSAFHSMLSVTRVPLAFCCDISIKPAAFC